MVCLPSLSTENAFSLQGLLAVQSWVLFKNVQFCFLLFLLSACSTCSPCCAGSHLEVCISCLPDQGCLTSCHLMLKHQVAYMQA